MFDCEIPKGVCYNFTKNNPARLIELNRLTAMKAHTLIKSGKYNGFLYGHVYRFCKDYVKWVLHFGQKKLKDFHNYIINMRELEAIMRERS